MINDIYLLWYISLIFCVFQYPTLAILVGKIYQIKESCKKLHFCQFFKPILVAKKKSNIDYSFHSFIFFQTPYCCRRLCNCRSSLFYWSCNPYHFDKCDCFWNDWANHPYNSYFDLSTDFQWHSCSITAILLW